MNVVILLSIYLDRSQMPMKHCTQSTKISALYTLFNTVFVSLGSLVN